MISRGNMRRQLRASGGITNARQGYGVGSWVKEKIRKIIPNELASVASKAAPVVAMFNPAIGGLMRGIGRFDQRGSISDALKQGVGTYAGGQAARYLGGQGFQKGFGTSGNRFTSPIKSGNKFSNFLDTGKEKLKGLIKTEGTSSTAKDILKNQFLIGGGTALVSLISQGLIDEPKQEAGESINDFMARRKISVSKQLKTYLGNTNKFRGMSEEELDTLVAQNMTEYDKDFASGSGGYNQGGRVGLAEGSDDMILPMEKPETERFLSYEEAKARNPEMFVDTTTSAYGGAVPEGTPTLEKVFELEVAEIAKVILGTRSSPREKGEIQDTETMSSKDFMKNAYLIPKVKKLSENYGYSEAEILKMIKDEMMTYSKPKKEMMNKGGIMRLNYMIGGEAKQMEAGAPPIMYSGNMDPNAQNQQAGLPSVPGPMQMAEDGPEFDMRENGGFQPLGRQEGKDDVPAMLAKNEFVMTADAVRAAGGGSIQKGAQKMYDTMKKLESRVS